MTKKNVETEVIEPGSDPFDQAPAGTEEVKEPLCSNMGCPFNDDTQPGHCGTNWGEDAPTLPECCNEFLELSTETEIGEVPVDDGSHKCDSCSLDFATCASDSVKFAIDDDPELEGAAADRIVSCGSYTPVQVHNLDECRAYIPSDLDRFGPKFTRDLPVPVEEHLLAEYAQEMARLHSRWVRTKLDAKAFAKSCKEVTDECEKRELELAEVINAGAEERPVRVYWSYDFTHHVKRLVRTDTNQVVEERPLEPEDYQESLPLFSTPDESDAGQEAETGSPEGGTGGEKEIGAQNENFEAEEIPEETKTAEELDKDWPVPGPQS